ECHVLPAPPDTIGPVTTLAFATLALTVVISAFIQGATGMGFAMIAAPVVALLDPGLIPVLLLVLMIPLNAYIAWRERSAIDWRGVRWISVGRFAGTFGGLWILLVVSAHALNLIIGWATVLAVAGALLAPAFHPSRSALATVGVITGVTETATGVGGPPLALAYQHGPGAPLRHRHLLPHRGGHLARRAGREREDRPGHAPPYGPAVALRRARRAREPVRAPPPGRPGAALPRPRVLRARGHRRDNRSVKCAGDR